MILLDLSAKILSKEYPLSEFNFSHSYFPEKNRGFVSGLICLIKL
ncbi:hypothetical protein C943_01598 [Mariniradius saccharolyticus AK6]|uniref:Uncharacterized protein n=1 Tax=Mariniradius saccharolyticus AK6 TaxID=1239962 RepID=M7XBP6_9BACT|nr:hypothetical protein C943_01598 [Mariniradius saccharolyticus AK6]